MIYIIVSSSRIELLISLAKKIFLLNCSWFSVDWQRDKSSMRHINFSCSINILFLIILFLLTKTLVGLFKPRSLNIYSDGGLSGLSVPSNIGWKKSCLSTLNGSIKPTVELNEISSEVSSIGQWCHLLRLHFWQALTKFNGLFIRCGNLFWGRKWSSANPS